MKADEKIPIEHKAGRDDTWQHIHRVQHYVLGVAKRLIDRAHAHDQSKLKPPEVGPFAGVSDKLHGLTYGSDEYKRILRETLCEAISHHYAHNRHHPEFFENGIEDMTLLDLLEMICDWKAASERHADGDIMRSIEINADPERFDFSPQLRRIFENTARDLFDTRQAA